MKTFTPALVAALALVGLTACNHEVRAPAKSSTASDSARTLSSNSDSGAEASMRTESGVFTEVSGATAASGATDASGITDASGATDASGITDAMTPPSPSGAKPNGIEPSASTHLSPSTKRDAFYAELEKLDRKWKSSGLNALSGLTLDPIDSDGAAKPFQLAPNVAAVRADLDRRAGKASSKTLPAASLTADGISAWARGELTADFTRLEPDFDQLDLALNRVPNGEIDESLRRAEAARLAGLRGFLGDPRVASAIADWKVASPSSSAVASEKKDVTPITTADRKLTEELDSAEELKKKTAAAAPKSGTLPKSNSSTAPKSPVKTISKDAAKDAKKGAAASSATARKTAEALTAEKVAREKAQAEKARLDREKSAQAALAIETARKAAAKKASDVVAAKKAGDVLAERKKSEGANSKNSAGDGVKRISRKQFDTALLAFKRSFDDAKIGDLFNRTIKLRAERETLEPIAKEDLSAYASMPEPYALAVRGVEAALDANLKDVVAKKLATDDDASLSERTRADLRADLAEISAAAEKLKKRLENVVVADFPQDVALVAESRRLNALVRLLRSPKLEAAISNWKKSAGAPGSGVKEPGTPTSKKNGKSDAWPAAPIEYVLGDVKVSCFNADAKHDTFVLVPNADGKNPKCAGQHRVVLKLDPAKKLAGDATKICLGTIPHAGEKSHYAICALANLKAKSCGEAEVESCKEDSATIVVTTSPAAVSNQTSIATSTAASTAATSSTAAAARAIDP